MQEVFQGDIWWIEPTPKMGSEQRGKRPALILQNDVANQYLKTTIVAIISSSGKVDMPEMVDVSGVEGMKKMSVADFAQVFTIDKMRLIKKIGTFDALRWDEVEQALQSIFLKTIR